MSYPSERVGKLHKKYNHIIAEMFDVLITHEVPQQDGEELLAWMLGISKGMRQASLVDHDTFETMATAWFFGAHEQGKDEEVSGDDNG